jgi:hypothetical protein
MTCSDSIDMNVDGHTIVTGGKTGEGLKIWDFRKLDSPTLVIKFTPE